MLARLGATCSAPVDRGNGQVAVTAPVVSTRGELIGLEQRGVEVPVGARGDDDCANAVARGFHWPSV
jgi:hypothetical protein